jgi:type IV secretory pathway VirB3-like protein
VQFKIYQYLAKKFHNCLKNAVQQAGTRSPKIFGIGLSRTGTTSLHVALVLLGQASIHYPINIAMPWLAETMIDL